MRDLALALACAATAGPFTAGCGSALWLITPRPDVTHYEVTRIADVAVTTKPRGAMVYVDGAEAGVTPRTVPIAFKEIRRQRRQMIWPAIGGTLIDLAATVLLTVAAADEEGPGLALPIAGAGLAAILTDIYLITGRSVVNEGVDIQPLPVEIGVRAPGYEDAARRVRVPDFTRLEFDLVPGAPSSEPPGSGQKLSPTPSAPSGPKVPAAPMVPSKPTVPSAPTAPPGPTAPGPVPADPGGSRKPR